MPATSRRAFLRTTGGVATLGVLAGCSGDGGDGETTGTPGGGGSGGAVTIGALEPISGPFAAWATVHRDGLQYAVDEVNADGGVLGGRQLEVQVADTGADAGQADSNFRRLVEQEGAVVTTGSVSSDVGIRVSGTAADLEVPHVLHMAGTDEIITQDTRHVFRLGILPASSYVQAQATAFSDAGYSSVGAIVADYAWGHSAEAAIDEHFEQDVNLQVAPVGASDFSSHIRQMPDDLEMLIASGHPPGSVTIANQVYELGFEPEVITGATTPSQLLASALNDRARQGYVHIHNANPYSQAYADTASAFAEGHEAQFNTHTAHGYVTGKLIAAAIEEGGEASGTAVSEALHQVQLDSLFVNPIQYNQYGELEDTVVLFSRLLGEAPSYDPNGSYSYEELYRSEPVPARVPGQ